MSAKNTFAGLVALTGLFLPWAPIHAGARAAKSRGMDRSGQGVHMRVQMYRNFLVIAEGQIGGVRGPLNFLIDTGASPSVINGKLAAQLGWATRPSSTVALGTSAAAQMSILPDLTFGPIHATSLPVLVADLSRFENDFGIAIAGILGMDVLSKSDFTVDYDARQIEFGNVPREGIPVNYDARAGTSVVSVKIGNRTARLLVDTGSEFVVLLGGNFGEVDGLKLQKASQPGVSFAEEKMHMQKFSAPEISIGERKFSSDNVFFVPGKTDPEFDGLLSVRALGFRRISYDRACQTLYLE